MKVLSYIIRIFLLPIGPFRKLNKSIQLYSCKRWYIKFAGPRVPEEIQTPVFFKSSRFYFLTSKCWWVEIFNGKSSAGNHEQRSTSFKETYLSQSTPKHASTEFIVNSNLLLPHIHIVCLSKAQKPGILDPNLVTVSYSTGAHYKLQAAVASSRISQPAVLDPPPHHPDQQGNSPNVYCLLSCESTTTSGAAAPAGPRNCSVLRSWWWYPWMHK